MTDYTYTIYDDDPSSSGSVAWPHATQITIRAESAMDAEAQVRQIVGDAASNLSATDGYQSGGALWYTIWDDAGLIVGDGYVTITQVS